MSDTLERLTSALAARYRIQEEIGAGGMATVFLADDIKHERKVAVKVLRPELAAVLGAERFLQEIKTTANLQHPHILPLFDSGEADSFLYYVMPFIDGETLRDKLNRETQLGIEEAVKITTEVADALDYAHRNNVIHRDIKPENILLHDRRPMVADFGIALAVSAAAGGRMTETGLSLGTPHYMSPEQATAEKDLTSRSDIYSLGSVLYEMLTGDPPHTGSTAQQIIMKIVTDDARPVTEVRKSVPSNVAAAVAMSLEKLPADRFAHASAFGEALADRDFQYGLSVLGESSIVGGKKGTNHASIVATTVLIVFLATVALWGWLRTLDRQVLRLDLDVGSVFPLSDIEVSPDGSTLVMSADSGGRLALYVRRLDEANFTMIPGTEGAQVPTFSPDGDRIAFVVPDRRLVTMSLSGGSKTTLFETLDTRPYDPHWAEDGTIVFAGDGGFLYRISAEGGTPELVADNLGDVNRPFVLPDGAILVGGPGGIRVVDAHTRAVTSVFQEPGHAVYIPSGHILHVTGRGRLFATPFDVRSKETTGESISILDGLGVFQSLRAFSVSGTDLLVTSLGQSFMFLSGTSTELQIVDRSRGIRNLVGDSPWGAGTFPASRPTEVVSLTRNTTMRRGTVLSGWWTSPPTRRRSSLLRAAIAVPYGHLTAGAWFSRRSARGPMRMTSTLPRPTTAARTR